MNRRLGFSLLEVLLAVAILVVLASLSLPRLQQPAQRLLLLEAQGQLAQLSYEIGMKVRADNADAATIRASLPPLLNSSEGEPLYRLSYVETARDGLDTGRNWQLLATPTPDSAANHSLIFTSDGRCLRDNDSSASVTPSDRPCGLR